MTVVETVRFLKDASDLMMPELERARLVEFVGANPEAGDLIPATGGVRKLRWALPGGGKRGGARVIYSSTTSGCPCSCLPYTARTKKQISARLNGTRWPRSCPQLFRAMRKVEEQNDEDEEPVWPPVAKKAATVGERIIEGLEEALAWSKGEELPVRVTHVQVPDVDVSKVRRRMGLSQTQFAAEVRLSARHAPKLGTGTRSSRYPDTSAVGRDCKTSGECRGRLEGRSMSGFNYGRYYGYPLQL